MKIGQPCEFYEQLCIECGECNICDLDPNKTCNNCCQCLESSSDYAKIIIDDILINIEEIKIEPDE